MEKARESEVRRFTCHYDRKKSTALVTQVYETGADGKRRLVEAHCSLQSEKRCGGFEKPGIACMYVHIPAT